MEISKEFEILIRRKMPFISNFLYVAMIFLLTFLLMLYVLMYPAIHSKSPAEMQTAYYILVVPDALKTLSSYSLFGLLFVVPFYFRARLQKPAILRFNENSLFITGDNISVDIPKSRIKKVYCNDLKNAFGEPKGKLQIVIQQNVYRSTTFRLKNYEQGGKLIDAFGALENVELASYEKEMIGNHEEDE